MLFSVLFYGFLLYLLYRLVFNFIIPIYKTTRQVKKSFRDMHEQMRQQTEGQATQQKTQSPKNSSNSKVGDYIDFEEVKD
jgi:hypothetical protein